MRAIACFLAVTLAAGGAFGWASNSSIATKGRRAMLPDTMWRKGVDALINHSVRENGYQWWMSECPPGPRRYELNVQTKADVQELIDLLAAMDVADPAIFLVPAWPQPDHNPKVGDVAPSELRVGGEEPFQGGRVGPKMGAVFSVNDIDGFRQWYENLPTNDDGARQFGVHTYETMPMPRIASLELYVDHPAVDLGALNIPKRIALLPSYQPSYAMDHADDPSVQRIEVYVAAHRTKRDEGQFPPEASQQGATP